MRFLLPLIMMSSLHAEVRLSAQDASRFVDLALAGIGREFPNKPGHVLLEKADIKSPREVTPVFYGHFDWHSSVHGHWTLVRLLRCFPEAPWAQKVKDVLRSRFTEDALKKEAHYLQSHPSFERMYGWAWALRLGLELRQLDLEEAKRWAGWFEPVECAIVGHAKEYLPKLSWPIRCGFHPESAFPLSQMLDWARSVGDHDFEQLIVKKAVDFYKSDQHYPVQYEPSGNDFFSAGLNEADLMRRCLTRKEFGEWIGEFFPDFQLGNLSRPVEVTDFTDGHLVHLVGLNLSRAWALRGIASALEGPVRENLLAVAKNHEQAGLRDTFSGHYEGDHWLGTFGVYLLTHETD